MLYSFLHTLSYTSISHLFYLLQKWIEKVPSSPGGGGGHPAQNHSDLPQSLLPGRLRRGQWRLKSRIYFIILTWIFQMCCEQLFQFVLFVFAGVWSGVEHQSQRLLPQHLWTSDAQILWGLQSLRQDHWQGEEPLYSVFSDHFEDCFCQVLCFSVTTGL